MSLMYGYGDIIERSTKGQVGSNFQQCPIYVNEVSNCSSCCVHAKNICFYVIWTSSSEIIAIVLIRLMISL